MSESDVNPIQSTQPPIPKNTEDHLEVPNKSAINEKLNITDHIPTQPRSSEKLSIPRIPTENVSDAKTSLIARFINETPKNGEPPKKDKKKLIIIILAVILLLSLIGYFIFRKPKTDQVPTTGFSIDKSGKAYKDKPLDVVVKNDSSDKVVKPTISQEFSEDHEGVVGTIDSSGNYLIYSGPLSKKGEIWSKGYVDNHSNLYGFLGSSIYLYANSKEPIKFIDTGKKIKTSNGTYPLIGATIGDGTKKATFTINSKTGSLVVVGNSSITSTDTLNQSSTSQNSSLSKSTQTTTGAESSTSNQLSTTNGSKETQTTKGTSLQTTTGNLSSTNTQAKVQVDNGTQIQINNKLYPGGNNKIVGGHKKDGTSVVYYGPLRKDGGLTKSNTLPVSTTDYYYDSSLYLPNNVVVKKSLNEKSKLTNTKGATGGSAPVYGYALDKSQNLEELIKTNPSKGTSGSNTLNNGSTGADGKNLTSGQNLGSSGSNQVGTGLSGGTSTNGSTGVQKNSDLDLASNLGNASEIGSSGALDTSAGITGGGSLQSNGSETLTNGNGISGGLGLGKTLTVNQAGTTATGKGTSTNSNIQTGKNVVNGKNIQTGSAVTGGKNLQNGTTGTTGKNLTGGSSLVTGTGTTGGTGVVGNTGVVSGDGLTGFILPIILNGNLSSSGTLELNGTTLENGLITQGGIVLQTNTDIQNNENGAVANTNIDPSTLNLGANTGVGTGTTLGTTTSVVGNTDAVVANKGLKYPSTLLPSIIVNGKPLTLIEAQKYCFGITNPDTTQSTVLPPDFPGTNVKKECQIILAEGTKLQDATLIKINDTKLNEPIQPGAPLTLAKAKQFCLGIQDPHTNVPVITSAFFRVIPDEINGKPNTTVYVDYYADALPDPPSNTSFAVALDPSLNIPAHYRAYIVQDGVYLSGPSKPLDTIKDSTTGIVHPYLTGDTKNMLPTSDIKSACKIILAGPLTLEDPLTLNALNVLKESGLLAGPIVLVCSDTGVPPPPPPPSPHPFFRVVFDDNKTVALDTVKDVDPDTFPTPPGTTFTKKYYINSPGFVPIFAYSACFNDGSKDYCDSPLLASDGKDSVGDFKELTGNVPGVWTASACGQLEDGLTLYDYQQLKNKIELAQSLILSNKTIDLAEQLKFITAVGIIPNTVALTTNSYKLKKGVILPAVVLKCLDLVLFSFDPATGKIVINISAKDIILNKLKKDLKEEFPAIYRALTGCLALDKFKGLKNAVDIPPSTIALKSTKADGTQLGLNVNTTTAPTIGLDTHSFDISVSSQNPITLPTTTDKPTPLVPCDGIENPCDFQDLMQLVNNVINWLIKFVVTPITAIMFAYAGFLYLTSQSNPGRRKIAHGIFTNVLRGYLILLGAWLIIAYILKLLGVAAEFILLKL